MNRTGLMLIMALTAACSGDDESLPTDAPVTPTFDAPAVPDAAAPVDPAIRGRYLVDHVSVCTGCHTPRLPTGAPDLANYLAGVECFVDIDPTDPLVGCIHSRNLTNHGTGLMNRTDEEIKTMFRDGLRPNGAALHPFMPYWVFHNMTDDDADAIVAYLRTVTGVDHGVPPNQAPFNNVPAPATYLTEADIPAAPAGNASAANGRYLAAQAGVCIECHTEENPPGPGVPINVAKVFQGGRGFPAAAFGLPVPPFPDVIYTSNITPHPTTGIGGRTVAQIVAELKMGVDPNGDGVCPPMPAGPMGEYGGLTDDDATDIANYILALPPANNMIPNECSIAP